MRQCTFSKALIWPSAGMPLRRSNVRLANIAEGQRSRSCIGTHETHVTSVLCQPQGLAARACKLAMFEIDPINNRSTADSHRGPAARARETRSPSQHSCSLLTPQLPITLLSVADRGRVYAVQKSNQLHRLQFQVYQCAESQYTLQHEAGKWSARLPKLSISRVQALAFVPSTPRTPFSL